jgi:protoporphyrinogen/coproporphyrinogen III oxidase
MWYWPETGRRRGGEDPVTATRVDAVVVGGGIAGLASAWMLRHRNVLLLEADTRVGGRICSEPRGKYWLNWGAHVFAGPESATGRLLAQMGVQAEPVPGELAALAMNGRLLTDGRVQTYPFRIPMAWSDRIAVLRAGIKVRLAVQRYGNAAELRPGEAPDERQQRVYDFLGDQTFSQFTGELPADADALFRPTVTRSAGSPEQVSAGAGVGYFRLVWDRKSGLSRNIVGGSAALTEAIGAGLGSRVVLGAEVLEVVQNNDSVSVRYRRGNAEEEVLASHCVLATPAPIARRLAIGLASETAEALRKVVYGPYVSAAFLTNETRPQPWDRSYAIATPKRAFNVFFNMTSLARSHERERQPGSSIMVFSPAALAAALLDLDDSEIIDRYLKDLDDIFPGFSGHMVEAHVRRWPLGLAYCFPGRGHIQEALTRPAERIHLAGDYLGTFYTETAVETGWSAANTILRALA